MFAKVFITLIIFVVVINVSGFQSQSRDGQFLSKFAVPDNNDLQLNPYSNHYYGPMSEFKKRAYVRLAGKRALVRLGKRAYVRLGKRDNQIPYIF
uniref:Uncharacterized protein n=1 Tax=Strongyloides papillosus TaxID=174720 RepID=A0A0N5C3R1_STREA